MDSLRMSFESLSILSSASKLPAEEACLVEAGHVKKARDIEDDTESFNEEDCLFKDMGLEEEEVNGGNFSPFSEAHTRRNSAHSQSNSASRSNEKNEGPFSHYSRASARVSSMRLHQNFAGNEIVEEEAYVGAFAHSSRPTAKLNSGRLRPASVRVRSKHEKENKSPDNINIGHKSHDIHRDRSPRCELFASCDDRSLPLDIAPASPDMATMRRRKSKKNNLSVRESLLAEAWERKREHMLHEELANVKERAKPGLLGRSSSDCGKLIADAQAAPSELRRSRTRSLTEDDFQELQGCIDLGFRFDESSIPDLCDTLPALEVYCAVAQSFQESPKCMSPVIQSPARCSSPASASSWRIASPGDDPQDVKGRLKHWAQAVACNARLCH